MHFRACETLHWDNIPSDLHKRENGSAAAVGRRRSPAPSIDSQSVGRRRKPFPTDLDLRERERERERGRDGEREGQGHNVLVLQMPRAVVAATRVAVAFKSESGRADGRSEPSDLVRNRESQSTTWSNVS